MSLTTDCGQNPPNILAVILSPLSSIARQNFLGTAISKGIFAYQATTNLLHMVVLMTYFSPQFFRNVVHRLASERKETTSENVFCDCPTKL